MQHKPLLFCEVFVTLPALRTVPASLSCSVLDTRSLASWAQCVSALVLGLSCQTVSPAGQEGLTGGLTGSVGANLRP